MRNQYLVMTVNALGLLEATDIVKSHKSPEYLIDLSSGFPSYVTPEIRYDNALFYQICRMQYGTDREKIRQINAISKYILIFDYGELFAKLYENGSDPAGTISSIESGHTDNSIEYHLGRLLNPEVGIKIKYSADETHTYVPFDKSSSMAKQCRISYIDQNIRTDLDNRLCLDIDFSNISLQLSKYYAYRGLYLTTGTRIPRNEQFDLNEHTVVVIPDLILQPTEDFDDIPLLFRQVTSPDGGDFKFEVVRDLKDANVFDGEGLISPAYSAYIRDHIHADAYSFQVRMPFIKGVLHTTDFHDFLNNDVELGERTITDIFDLPRDLSRTQIILTKSMFKCSGWLNNYWNSLPKKDRIYYGNDPMRFYFEKAVKKYNHTLYVSGSDASFKPTGYEQLGYQYLDTLKMSPEDFDKLIAQHFEIGEQLIKDTYNPKNKQPDNAAGGNAAENAAENAGGNAAENAGESASENAGGNAAENAHLSPYAAAALINPAFYSEPRLKAEIFQLLRNLRVDCGMGSLWSMGEHRYLSGDLMALLWYLVRLIEKHHAINSDITDIEYFEGLKGKILNKHFYMPRGSDMQPLKDDYYALFRSPHLSRNEECIMKPYIPDSEEDPYNKYFGNLTGVIMTPTGSLIDAIESGADNDGDFLHIFSDRLVVDAVKQGCYSDDYMRVLPIVDIPSSDSAESTPTSNSDFVKLIINTFSNYTGLISNLSVVFADEQYNYFAPETAPEDCHCPKTTIVAGLEIDSTKHGAHPVESIKELQKSADDYTRNGVFFTNCKDTFKRMRGFNYKKAYAMKDKDGVVPKVNPNYFLRYKPGEKGITIFYPQEKAHNIMRLIYAFAQKDASSRDNIEYLIANSFIPEYSEDDIKFRFEKDVQWAAKLDREKLKKVRELAKSYADLILSINKYRQMVLRNSKTYSKLYNLIRLKYDWLDMPIKDGYTVSCKEAMSEAIDLIALHIDTKEKANAILEDYSLKWMYQPRDNRINALCEILGIAHPQDIPDYVIDLVTDFSGDGFYILYYLIELAIESLNSKLSKEEIIDKYIAKSKRNTSDYFATLLSTYKDYANYRVSFDQYTSEIIGDVEKDDDGGNENNRPYWKNELANKAYELLSDIVIGQDNPDSNESRLLILKYAHCVRKETDRWGTFFWDVIPREDILNNIKRGGK